MSKQQAPAGTAPAPGISTLLTNLHLLDLDRRHDWPSINPQTFTGKNTLQNEKNRILCVEWALYRLFEIWDIEETRNKLGPFFPAHVPLQSLNLRAALFRSLNELKKNETLGREVIIRKTMFDDCKGDKLWELLAYFSTIVLRKVLAEGSDGKASIAGRLAVAKRVTKKEHESLLPLAIAHRSSLTALLHKKEELRARYKGFGKLLDSKEQELDQRFEAIVKTQGFLDGNPIPDHTVARVSKLVEKHWQGDARLVDVIAQGEEQRSKDSLLEEPFFKIWPRVANGTFDGPIGFSQHGLLKDLEQRVTAQEARLNHWKEFKDAIKRDVKPINSSKAQSPTLTRSKSVKPGVQKQRDLVFSPRKSPRKSGWGVEEKDESPTVTRVNSHNQELQKQKDLVFSPRKSPRKSDNDIGKVESEHLSSSISMIDQNNDIPISGTKTSNLPDSTKPNSSAQENQWSSHLNLSTQDTSIDDSDRSEFSEISSGHLHYREQPGGVKCVKDQSNHRQNTRLARRNSQDCLQQLHNQTFQPNGKCSKREEIIEDDDLLAEQIITMTLNAAPTPAKSTKPSLAERTRQSILSSASPDRLQKLTSDSNSPPSLPTNNTTDRSRSFSVTPNAPTTLQERTRQSISLLSSRPSLPHKSTHDRRTSKVYPTNQFETPRKQMPRIKEFTPPEELFSPGAGYDSVFKSRPKVGFSPVASPAPDGSRNGAGNWGAGSENRA